MNPFSLLLWAAEHWWIFAVIAVVALVAALWGGIVSLGVVVKALADIAAAIVKFFAQPADQIAAKVLYGIAVCGFGIWIGYLHGTTKERAVWKAREAQYKAAIEKLNKTAEERAQRDVKAAAETERKDAFEEGKRIEIYAHTLPQPTTDDCRITDADLAAAGVRAAPRGHRRTVHRHH